MAADPKNTPGNPSPMARLPKKDGGGIASLPKADSRAFQSKPVTPLPLAAFPAPAAQKKETPAPAGTASKEKRANNIGPIFWTLTSIITMIVNVVLIIVLVIVLGKLREARMTNLTAIAPDLLGGLYTNFEKMDSAHITKTIPVDATIPVKFDLQLNQQTNVVLSENVLITNALVTVNTGGLNITRAAANIVLPQGTTLPVFLNLTVPVDTSIPVKLEVAVDIPLNETQLHEPFVGLQQVVAPLYCLVKADAKGIGGQAVCK
jgi:hypothetical protein